MTNPFCSVEVGDFIRACHKGIHKVTKIEKRFKTQSEYDYYYSLNGLFPGFYIGQEFSSLVYYQCIIDGNMNIKKNPGREHCCDAAFCKVVSPMDLMHEGMDIKNKYDKAANLIYDELDKK